MTATNTIALNLLEIFQTAVLDNNQTRHEQPEQHGKLDFDPDPDATEELGRQLDAVLNFVTNVLREEATDKVEKRHGPGCPNRERKLQEASETKLGSSLIHDQKAERIIIKQGNAPLADSFEISAGTKPGGEAGLFLSINTEGKSSDFGEVTPEYLVQEVLDFIDMTPQKFGLIRTYAQKNSWPQP